MDVKRKVIPVARGDCRESAEVLGRAFLDEPVSLMVYRGSSPEKRLHNLTADFTAEMEVCIRRGSPLQVRDDGRVVAVAVIYPPGAYPLPWIEQARIFIGSILGHDLYDIRLWWRWLAEAEEFHPREPHYYLEYLGVLPEYQGKGFGSSILQCLAAKADELNTGCYLETVTPENVPLYQHYGFRVLAEKQIIGLNAWFMNRPPSTSPETMKGQ